MTKRTYRIFYPKVVPGETISLELLNDIFTPLTFGERLRKLYNYFDEDEVLFTSSFGTNSVFLLHLIHQIRPTQKIYFIDTTYHFPETLAYKEQLTRLFNLRVVTIRPEEEPNRMTREEQWWKDHPRMCCTINKITPLEPLKARHKVWISGLMAWQTEFRSRLRIFEKQGDILKFHPLIDIDEGEVLYHLERYRLPKHPLLEKGYGSVGCTHCTQPGSGRSGRWAGTGKTECGLHPGFFNKDRKDW
ncbi:MAG: phosphoadenylyl-sulfate reductase [Bacteroidetes bacterium]|nr:MAG: phosphoadenylyl-sulfate reductase [Bacteroidota bacterium]